MKNHHTVTLNKNQMMQIVDSLEASIRICTGGLIERKPEEQIMYTVYAADLEKIKAKLLHAIACCG